MSRTWHHGAAHKRIEWRPKDRNARLMYEHLWFKKEPKAWRKLYKHRKRRAEWKALKERTVDWENAVYPLNSKPWIWYW